MFVRSDLFINVTEQTIPSIDENLLDEAYSLMPGHNKKAVIEIALKEFVSSRKQKNLRDLRGKIKFDDNYDYKAMRDG